MSSSRSRSKSKAKKPSQSSSKLALPNQSGQSQNAGDALNLSSVTISGSITKSSQFSGPLPPPDALDGYEQVLPGAAERILKMAEQQVAHRQDLERQVVASDIANSRLGLWIGGIALVLAIVVGGLVATAGKDWQGLALGATLPATLLLALVKVTRDRRKEREGKAAMSRPRE